MHEASHFILHQPYFDKLKNSNNRITYNKTFVACSKVGDSGLAPRTESEWLEYQADALAAALLMPKKTFTSYAIDLFRKYGVQGRHITSQANRKNYNIIEDISQKFMVSKQAAQIRLTHLGLIKE